MSEAGRPTELDEELTLKIRKLVLKGFKYKQIREELNINSNTWDTWVFKDYQGLRANLQEWKREKMLRESEKVLNECLRLPVERIYLNDGNEVIKTDSSILKIKQDTAKYLTETLGKNDGYSKRSELTGKDGKDLPTPILANVLSNDSITEDSEAQEAN